MEQLRRCPLSRVLRSAQVSAVVESLQRDMSLLCVTGVEDRLQDGVRQTLETLRSGAFFDLFPDLDPDADSQERRPAHLDADG